MTPESLFRRGLKELGLSPGIEAIHSLCSYLAELQKWNRRMNLVAEAPPETLIETHFLDSLTLLSQIGKCPPPGLLDVGSGAGFPGLVIKICCPELPVALVEPRQKRCVFLRHIIRILGLENITVLETRLAIDNPAVEAWLGRTPLITSRAFAAINNFLALAEPFSAPGGRVICMKGRKKDEELAEWQKESPGSPYTLTKAISLQLPLSNTPRNLLMFTKSA